MPVHRIMLAHHGIGRHLTAVSHRTLHPHRRARYGPSWPKSIPTAIRLTLARNGPSTSNRCSARSAARGQRQTSAATSRWAMTKGQPLARHARKPAEVDATCTATATKATTRPIVSARTAAITEIVSAVRQITIWMALWRKGRKGKRPSLRPKRASPRSICSSCCGAVYIAFSPYRVRASCCAMRWDLALPLVVFAAASVSSHTPDC